MNNTGGNTNLLGTADYQGRVGIHIRGSTSESYPKQQYSVELWDETNNDKKVSLLGMPAESGDDELHRHMLADRRHRLTPV